GHAGVAAYILHLLPDPHVGDDDLVIFSADPDQGDLGTAIGIEGRQIRGGTRRNQGAHRFGNRHSRLLFRLFLPSVSLLARMDHPASVESPTRKERREFTAYAQS